MEGEHGNELHLVMFEELIGYFVTSYHTDGEGVDVIDVSEAILPGDETLDVYVELIPNAHNGIIILLISENRTSNKLSSRKDETTSKVFNTLLEKQ